MGRNARIRFFLFVCFGVFFFFCFVFPFSANMDIFIPFFSLSVLVK